MPLLRWIFYCFAFSLPFETVGIGRLEPPEVFGALLLLCALIQPGVFLRWPPRAFWCFVVYLYLAVTLGALEFSRYPSELAAKMFLLSQLTILCWLAYCLMRDDRVAQRALLVFVFSCALLAALQVTGVVSRAADTGAKIQRVTALGFNPNNLARILALGLIALFGLTYGARKSLLRPRYVALPLMGVLGVAIVQTGSRGGLLALSAGLLIFVLSGATLRSKLRNLAAVTLVLGFFAFVALQSETMRGRFEKTLEEGDVARREQIYPSAWEMFKEKPLVGWGAITSTYELGSRLGHPEEDSKNPHNLILYALVSSGLVGALPLLLGIGLVVWSAWRARKGLHGMLPLSMVVVVLVANMSGLWLYNKMHWLVMAYALASSQSYFNSRRSKPKTDAAYRAQAA
jgi:O-antigen ligase